MLGFMNLRKKLLVVFVLGVGLLVDIIGIQIVFCYSQQGDVNE